MSATTTRKTAEARREEILDAAMDLEHSGEEWAARLIAGCGKG